MVEEPTTLTGGEPPGPPRRRRPSRTRIIVRRLVALVLVLGLLAVLGGSAWALIGGRSEEAAPPPPAPPPPPKTCNIAFPEGFTRAQMADKISVNVRAARRECGFVPRLERARYLELTAGPARVPRQFAADAKSPFLEGFLFPATYRYTPHTSTSQLVKAQLASFQHNWAKVDMRYARSKNLTPYDVLIIASMVEKEVVAPEERRLVAAVIYNRLKARMTLGIDATIRYALRIPPTESLRESHLRDSTPYNTRIHPGLPPTPIANPGLASLRAAARPAKVKYLYYVRKPDKLHHFFTASERDFINYKNAHGY